jgi:hypothetical protein
MGTSNLARTAIAAVAAVALAAPAAADAAVDPPHSIIVFPSRDFVSTTGYTPGDQVTLEVQHPFPTANGLATASGTVGADGVFEVNHPGGACWAGFTPDIRPGDTVRMRVNGSGTPTTEDTVTADVASGRPIQTGPSTVEVHGTARDALGAPLPVAQLEHRLVDPDLFDTGRRTLRAPGAGAAEGTIAYDAPGSTRWTATYPNLSAGDVSRALASEARIMWLGPAPAAGTEVTVQENGAAAIAGPSAPCRAPLEKVQIPGSETNPPSAPGTLTASADRSTVTLDWGAASDDVGVQTYAVYRDGEPVATVQTPDATAPAPTHFVDLNVPAGTYSYTVRAQDAAGNEGPPSNDVTVTTSDNPAPAPAVIHDPPAAPHLIIAFPARDFISADGYAGAAKVSVFVIRGGNVIAGAEDVPPNGSLVEVNHPGGGCWAGTTPDLRPGDVVRLVAKDAAGAQTSVDQTTVMDVTAQRPVRTAPDTVEVHGSAVAPGGGQFPIAQLEQRLITSSKDPFIKNGKRVLRSATEGSVSYDGTSTRWTARYTGLSPDDVTRALGAESRMLWLGRDPLAANEQTIFENGDQVAGGPTAPCTAPAAAQQPQVAIDQSALTFGSAAVGTPGDEKAVKITNNGRADLHLDRAYLAGSDPGSFSLSDDPCDGTVLAPGAGCTVKVRFTPERTGSLSASLNVADDAHNDGYQSVALSGSGVAAGAPGADVSPTALAFGTVVAGSPKSLPVKVTNSGDADLVVQAAAVAGPAAADYAVTATTCDKVAPGASCTVTVQFAPTATGSRAATLEIPHNAAGAKASVPLSGTGAGSTFALSPSPVSFGTVNRASTKGQTVTVKNSGTVAFRVTAARVSADAGSAFSVPGGQACVGTTLAPGKTCNLTVNFRPSAAQAYTANLDVAGDASSLPATVTARLTGSGK